ncbi:MAG: DJ-1/PfpI family protein [Aquificaceae bacterium]|nr:DJ-1/PfpI family protein [Aquificaceae bacterium]MDW8295163.1 DJ-1/PfpI family protein [Aquificaceae bacterium]MDW8422832.1 DJ-1/PfpI family protein [Aquificaceae bacterium]
MKKVLILTGDASEALEVFYPLYRLREEGFEVKVATPSKKIIQTVVHDMEPSVMETYTEKLGYRLEADITLKDVNPEEFDALFIPGGRAPEYVRTYPKALEIVRHFFEKDKPVATLCHGPQLLVAAGVVQGRKVSAFFVLKPDIETAGGEYVDGVVVDKNLVSGRAWPDLPDIMREFVKLLRG